jgi:hypothetical protein
MIPSLIPFGIVLSLLTSAPAPQKPEPPKGPPPRLYKVEQLDGNQLTVFVTVAKQVPYTYYEFVTVQTPGQPVSQVQVAKTGSMTVNEVVPVQFDLSLYSATDTFGKKLTKEAVSKLLIPGKTVALTDDPNGLDPTRRATLAPDMVILSVSAKPLQ